MKTYTINDYTNVKDELLKQKPKIIVDNFDRLMHEDLMNYDEELRVKLNRDVTQTFNDWVDTKLKTKQAIRINVMGDTRSGKSLMGLKIIDRIVTFYDYDFDLRYIVCGNQREYRRNLANARFGQPFQVDENAFSNVGLGMLSEIMQLKDVNNIIAKKNIHTIFITPMMFLNNNAQLGLKSYGRDNNNWVSRFLLYKLSPNDMNLLGYVVVDVGQLFIKYGCSIFKITGGCTNPNNLKLKDIPQNYKDDLYCVSDKHPIEDENVKACPCPFYEVCAHPLRDYEKKKDAWINKETAGGLDDRTFERYELAIKILIRIGEFDSDSNMIKLNPDKSKQLEPLVKALVPAMSNTIFTITEVKELVATLVLFKAPLHLQTILEALKDDKITQSIKAIKNGEALYSYLFPNI